MKNDTKMIITCSCLLGGFFAFLVNDAFMEHNRHRLYGQAHTQAVYQFGDRKPPMMAEEREEWYKHMGVILGNRPNSRQLQQFLDCRIEN